MRTQGSISVNISAEGTHRLQRGDLLGTHVVGGGAAGATGACGASAQGSGACVDKHTREEGEGAGQQTLRI